MLHLQKTGELISDQTVPVCCTPQTLSSAFELLVTLCVGCVPNMKLLTNMLTDMFYSGNYLYTTKECLFIFDLVNKNVKTVCKQY